MREITIAHTLAADEPGNDVVDLGKADLDAMPALTRQTQPGSLGRAHAVRRPRRDQPSRVDAHRDGGPAGRLTDTLRRAIFRRGDTPFLHVFDNGRTAIAACERLALTTRQPFYPYRITHADN